MRTLIVDDEKVRHETLKKCNPDHEFHHAYQFQEALRELALFSPFDFIHLDYDLLDQAGTGMSVVQEIIKLPVDLKPRNVNCHSLNLYRRTVMAKLLIRNGVTATCRAFE